MTWIKEDGDNFVGSAQFQRGNSGGVYKSVAAGWMSKKSKKVDAQVDVAWAAAGAMLCFWVVATLVAARSRPHMLAVPVVVAAASVLRFLAVVAAAAVLAVAFDGEETKGKLSGEAVQVDSSLPIDSMRLVSTLDLMT
jgi:hypothetical protein